MQAFTFTLIVLCSVALAFGGFSGGRSSGGSRGSISISRPAISRPVVVVRPQPPRPVVVVHPQPARPVVVVHPQPSRPVVVIRPQPRPVIVIRRRPVTYVPIIYPIYHPVPIYTVVITSNRQQQVNIPPAECTKNGQSIFQYCQSQVTRSYAPATLNSTWRTCCSTYAESSCYINNAGQYCSSSAASALIKHSQDVANYFGSSICQAIQFTSWDSTCSSNLEDASKKYYSSAVSKPAFIALPTANGNEKPCLDKLRARPEGDLTKRCLNASLDAWDPTRTKIVNSQVFESCCAMYDTLDCLQTQAQGICTDSEIADLTNYKTISTGAFSQGVCRAVPYANANRVCRGDLSSPTGSGSFAVPSILITLTVTLFALVQM